MPRLSPGGLWTSRGRYARGNMAISVENNSISTGTVMMDPSSIPCAYAATFASLLSGGVVTGDWLTLQMSQALWSHNLYHHLPFSLCLSWYNGQINHGWLCFNYDRHTRVSKLISFLAYDTKLPIASRMVVISSREIGRRASYPMDLQCSLLYYRIQLIWCE